MLHLLMKPQSIDVVEAEDGVAAVEAFKGFSEPVIGMSRLLPYCSKKALKVSDTVLLDINMPKMDGYQAATEMRAMEKKTADRGKATIIAVTALASEAERRRGMIE